MNQIKYDKAKELIQEGDILLFRGSGIIGALILIYIPLLIGFFYLVYHC